MDTVRFLLFSLSVRRSTVSMSRLANDGLIKADSPIEIRISKRVRRSVDDPLSAKIVGAFFRSTVGGHSLEIGIKLELDCARDQATCRMACAAANSSGSVIDSA